MLVRRGLFAKYIFFIVAQETAIAVTTGKTNSIEEGENRRGENSENKSENKNRKQDTHKRPKTEPGRKQTRKHENTRAKTRTENRENRTPTN